MVGGGIVTLAALDPAEQILPAQIDVDAKTNEISRFVPLLQDLVRIITADAPPTRREHAGRLVENR
jgi:hypothetical protein